MKILKGAYKGVELAIPEHEEVRPTVDHLKKNIMRLIENLPRKNVWDLFAGPGGVGLELLSNGTLSVVFVERLKRALACLHLNIAECRLKDPSVFGGQTVNVVAAPVENFLQDPSSFGVGGKPDFIFMDPPYGQKWMERIVPWLRDCRLVTRETRILAEHVVEDPLPAGVTVENQETYGPKVLTLFRLEGRGGAAKLTP